MPDPSLHNNDIQRHGRNNLEIAYQARPRVNAVKLFWRNQRVSESLNIFNKVLYFGNVRVG